MNESCHTEDWGMSHKAISHVTQRNGACHTEEWVMSHALSRIVSRISTSHVTPWHSGLRHVTQRNESCHAKERVLSPRGMSHVTRIESCHTHCLAQCHALQRVMSHISTICRRQMVHLLCKKKRRILVLFWHMPPALFLQKDIRAREMVDMSINICLCLNMSTISRALYLHIYHFSCSFCTRICHLQEACAKATSHVTHICHLQEACAKRARECIFFSCRKSSFCGNTKLFHRNVGLFLRKYLIELDTI